MKDKGTMPDELFLYFQCERYNTLLKPGGILDQPYWLWHLVDYAGLCHTVARAAIDEDEHIEAEAERRAEEMMKNALIQKSR